MAERFDLGVAEAVNGAGVRVGIRCSAYTTPREFVSRAFLYNRQGQYEKALEYYQKDLNIYYPGGRPRPPLLSNIERFLIVF